MSQISATAVNELRKRTDQPLMDCKRALTEANGDLDQAVKILQTRGKGVGDKRIGNETTEGRVGIFIDNASGLASIIEFCCESAPTAKNDRVLQLVNELAEAVVRGNPADPQSFLEQKFGAGTVSDRINEVVSVIREKMIVRTFARLSGGVFGQYIHHDGMLGVLLQCDGATANDEVLRDVAAHVAALNPPYTVVADVPADVLEKEKAFQLQQIKDDPKNAGKPANIMEKIAEGVLTEQPMANAAKYPNKTVGQILQGLGLTAKKAVRYKVGATAV